jgi:hypothetical protein
MITIKAKEFHSVGKPEAMTTETQTKKTGGFMSFIGADPAKIAKYLYVYILVVLCGAVLFLFNKYMELDKYVRETQAVNNVNQQVVISKNTEAINSNTKILERINFILDTRQPLPLSTDRK